MNAGSTALACAAVLASVTLAAAPVHAGTVALPLQAGGAFTVPVRSLHESRYAATVRQQFDFSCGSAAVATLLRHHYGHPASEQQVFDAMFAGGDADAIRQHGFSLLDMKRHLAALGFDADGFEAPLASLSAAGVPAIVLINERGYNHFVVVKGLRHGRVLFGDPAGGTRVLPEAAFEALRANGIVFVVSNHRAAARFDVDAEWHVQPRAPLAGTGDAARAALTALPKLGSADF